MKKIWHKITILLNIILGLGGCAHPNHSSFISGIDKIIAEDANDMLMGVVVMDASNKEIIYSHNPEKFFVPASNTKIVTGYAALKYLGPDFYYNTTIHIDSLKIHGHILEGNVYLQFSGDPTFTYDDLYKLLAELRKKEIREIKGHIFIDDTIFDDSLYTDGVTTDDLNFCYAAPITGALINKNCYKTELVAEPGHVRPILITEGFSPITIDNKAVIVEQDGEVTASPLKLKYLGNLHYHLSGCIKKGDKLDLGIAIREPDKVNKLFIENILHELGIKLKGEITKRPTPKGLVMLAEHRSENLVTMLNEMEKESDNIIAHSFNRILAHKYYHEQGSPLLGAKATMEIIGDEYKDRLYLFEGAGASLYNLFQAEGLAKLLYDIYHQPEIKQIFIDSLPISGVDGTLKNRLSNPLVKGKLLAKTGSMMRISGLSGYLRLENKDLIVVLLSNNVVRQTEYAKLVVEEKIINYLVEKYEHHR